MRQELGTDLEGHGRGEVKEGMGGEGHNRKGWRKGKLREGGGR